VFLIVFLTGMFTGGLLVYMLLSILEKDLDNTYIENFAVDAVMDENVYSQLVYIKMPCEYTIIHNLNTRDVVVNIQNENGGPFLTCVDYKNKNEVDVDMYEPGIFTFTIVKA